MTLDAFNTCTINCDNDSMVADMLVDSMNDQGDLPAAFEMIQSLLDSFGATKLTMDLDRVKRISPEALSYIFQIGKHLDRIGGRFLITNASEAVKATLRVVRMDQMDSVTVTGDLA